MARELGIDDVGLRKALELKAELHCVVGGGRATGRFRRLDAVIGDEPFGGDDERPHGAAVDLGEALA